MTRIKTEPEYFENTRKSRIRPIQGERSEQPTFKQPLLLILEWEYMYEYVYKTHSIFVQEDTVEVQPYEERENKTPQEIIQHYIELDKLPQSDPQIKGILACNPHKYPIEKLTGQYI